MAASQKNKSVFLNRNRRAEIANATLKEIIPQILNQNSRAQAGISNSELLRSLPAVKAGTPSLPKLRLAQLDTFTAAHELYTSNPDGGKIGVLNMASPKQPGGGVVRGASAQEESLCLRSTLYPSLAGRRKQLYPIPLDGLIYTPDVLIFRGPAPELKIWNEEDRFFVDVISCAAVRKPTLVKVEGQEKQTYKTSTDRDWMEQKVRYVMRCAALKGCRRLVLGAMGCGAYGNPIWEVATIMRKVLCANESLDNHETWSGVEEIVIAIWDQQPNKPVWNGFKDIFGQVKEVDVETE